MHHHSRYMCSYTFILQKVPFQRSFLGASLSSLAVCQTGNTGIQTLFLAISNNHRPTVQSIKEWIHLKALL